MTPLPKQNKTKQNKTTEMIEIYSYLDGECKYHISKQCQHLWVVFCGQAL